MKKQDLPTKPCAACGRPFAWRRKWAKVWDEVRYCSDACRTGRWARALVTREADGRRDGLKSPASRPRRTAAEVPFV